MAKSTRSMASAALLAPGGGQPLIAMTGGGRVQNRATWVFLWYGITLPLKFIPAPAPPPPPEP